MKQAKKFYELAIDFCNYIENNTLTENDIDNLIKYLMNIYMNAIDLPKVLPDNIDYDKFNIKANIKLDEKLKIRYWEVFNPLIKEEPVSPTIQDDLEDIVNDLSKGIIEYREGRINNAIFLWQYTNIFHTGNHIVDLIRALHSIREKNNI